MPHLQIEYSKGLETRTDIPGLVKALHGAMVASEVFPTAGIRVRAHAADHALVGDGLAENDFLAMTLSVGAGRETAVLRAEGETIFTIAQKLLAEPLSGEHFALSLEIRVSNPDLSWKETPIHRRLSKGAP